MSWKRGSSPTYRLDLADYAVGDPQRLSRASCRTPAAPRPGGQVARQGRGVARALQPPFSDRPSTDRLRSSRLGSQAPLPARVPQRAERRRSGPCAGVGRRAPRSPRRLRPRRRAHHTGTGPTASPVTPARSPRPKPEALPRPDRPSVPRGARAADRQLPLGARRRAGASLVRGALAADGLPLALRPADGSAAWALSLLVAARRTVRRLCDGSAAASSNETTVDKRQHLQ